MRKTETRADFGVPAAFAGAYDALLEAIGRESEETLARRADDLDQACHREDPRAQNPPLQMLRVRIALTSAMLRVGDARAAVGYAHQALRTLRGLRDVAELATDETESAIAEAHLALCAHASSTARRALHFHQGRVAAQKALACNPQCAPAHFALAALLFHAPRSFGGSREFAMRHLECALAAEPRHRAATMLLIEALVRGGEREAARNRLATLERAAPRLAARVAARLELPLEARRDG